MNLELVILEGPEAGRRISVPAAPVTLGRAPAAAMAFPDDGFISSVHLSMQAEGTGVRITDLRSTNGTFLNGERVTSGLAGIGDTIQIGTMTMQVSAAQQQAAPVFSSPVSAAPKFDATLMGGPALPRMDIPAPPPMPSPVAATTTIPQISVDGSEKFRRHDAKQDAQPDKVLREKISALQGPLFVMVNAAADESVAAVLTMGDVDLSKQSLWKDEGSAAPARWAPYLVPVTANSPLLNVLLDKGWGRNWVSVIASSASLDELLQHFSRFLKVQMDQTGGIYFRFYDPQVLREFLPSGSAAEIEMFFGPVREWLLEGDTKTTLIQASHNAEGMSTKTHSLTEN